MSDGAGTPRIEGLLFNARDAGVPVRGYLRLRPHAVLLGPNGSGKSTVLEALNVNPPSVGWPAAALGYDAIDSDRASFAVLSADPGLGEYGSERSVKELLGELAEDESADDSLFAGWEGCGSYAEVWIRHTLPSLHPEGVAALTTSPWFMAGRSIEWCLPPPAASVTNFGEEEFAERRGVLLEEFGIDPRSPEAGWIPTPAVTLAAEGANPRVIHAPTGAAALGDQILTDLAAAVQIHWGTGLRLFRRPETSWLDARDRNSVRVRSELANGLGWISARASSLLPKFVEAGEVELRTRPVIEWESNQPCIEISLVDRILGNSIAYADGPAGFRLWIELAVLDALADLRRIAATASPFSLSSADLRDIARKGLASVFDGEELAWEETERSLPPVLAANLYLVDEPERGLHPALQRELPAIFQAMAARGSQSVLATHSPYLLALERSTTFSYCHIDRETRHWQLEPIDLVQLDGLSVHAGELGFDRGELLAAVRLLAFVEGESDAAFLSEAIGTELRQAGVLLIPLQGVNRAARKGLVDGVLVGLGSWSLAIVFDDLNQTDVDLLVEDADYRRECADGGTLEKINMARVIDRAYGFGRRIHPIGIAVKDVFDLVDEAVVREYLKQHHPAKTFPGHQQARAAVEKNWKQGYLRRYGLNLLDPTLFRDLGKLTRDRGLRTAGLELVLHRLCSAAESEPNA